MLTWKEYDSFVKSIQQIKSLFEMIELNVRYVGDVNVITKIQSDIIEIGTSLENELEVSGLENKSTITALESICENLYQWYESDISNKSMYRRLIIDSFDDYFNELRKCEGDTSLAVCAIIKDEARYIQEWLEYHIYYGVKKFYIYDNESSDNTKKILGSYINSGIVEYTYWPGTGVQQSAYNDAINKHRADTGYIAFIDADEFLTPVKGGNLPDIIEDILLLNTQSGAVGVNWRVYGSAGIEKYNEELVTEKYLYRAEDRNYENRHIKTIVNPRCVLEYNNNPHSPSMKDGYFVVSENGTPIIGPWFYESDCSKLRINHYYSKSKEEFFDKYRRGWPDQPKFVPDDNDIKYIYDRKEESFNEVYDESGANISEHIKDTIRSKKIEDEKVDNHIINEEKIAFIACTNNEQYREEMEYYINHLEIPVGYTTEIICIKGAQSMASGYNKGMMQTDAKYKVYLHQDVYITKKDFISEVVNIFEDSTIGMIGVVGTTEDPDDANYATCWEYGCVSVANGFSTYKLVDYPMGVGASSSDKSYKAKAIDGMLMITQYDIPWDEQHFDGFHFYDISQSKRFLEEGLSVVLPITSEVWAIHDSGVNLGAGYDRYRNIFRCIYSGKYKITDSVYEDSDSSKLLVEKFNCIVNELESGEKFDLETVKRKQLKVQDLIVSGLKNRRILHLYVYLEIIISEMENGQSTTAKNIGFSDFSNMYKTVNFLLWRLRNGDDGARVLLESLVSQGKITNYFISITDEHTRL